MLTDDCSPVLSVRLSASKAASCSVPWVSTVLDEFSFDAGHNTGLLEDWHLFCFAALVFLGGSSLGCLVDWRPSGFASLMALIGWASKGGPDCGLFVSWGDVWFLLSIGLDFGRTVHWEHLCFASALVSFKGRFSFSDKHELGCSGWQLNCFSFEVELAFRWQLGNFASLAWGCSCSFAGLDAGLCEDWLLSCLVSVVISGELLFTVGLDCGLLDDW